MAKNPVEEKKGSKSIVALFAVTLLTRLVVNRVRALNVEDIRIETG